MQRQINENFIYFWTIILEQLGVHIQELSFISHITLKLNDNESKILKYTPFGKHKWTIVTLD